VNDKLAFMVVSGSRSTHCAGYVWHLNADRVTPATFICTVNKVLTNMSYLASKEVGMVYAEVKRSGGWQVVSTEGALLLRDEPMRCNACYGPVYLMRDYTRERKTRFTHRRSFAGCGGSRGGNPLRHPSALD
jgi:hypothetical protein